MSGRVDCLAPLFVPGDRPERFDKAAASGADAVIVDLEDAVAAERKALARDNLRADFTALPVVVRVNGADTAWHRDDVERVCALGCDAVMLPKAEDDSALAAVCAAAREAGIAVIALIETAAGLAAARAVAAAGVDRLAFGSIDYCVDLGCAHRRDALLAARGELLLASRLAGLPAPLDGVTAALGDAAAVEDDARYARDLGFGGKLCVHPAQVGPVYAGFRPDDDEVAWARRVLAAGDGAQAVDGKLVDRPVRLRAEAIVRLFERCAGPA